MPFLDEEKKPGLTLRDAIPTAPTPEMLSVSPRPQEEADITPEMRSVVENLSQGSATATAAPSVITESPEDQARAERIMRIAKKHEAESVEVERTLPSEIGASLVRGGLGLVKLVPQVAKIVGSDVLGPVVKGITGTDIAKETMTPLIEGLEDVAASPTWKPSKEAGGAPIELERIVSNPREVVDQITSQVTNPRFWASQFPEGVTSMIPAILGAWAPRAVAMSGKLGAAIEAINASKTLTAAEKTAQLAPLATKLNRIGTIGMYGASMAMEAGQGEEKVREFEEKNPDKPIPWGTRVFSILGTGVVAGGLEALSLGKVIPGKLLGRTDAAPLSVIENFLNGRAGREIVNQVLSSVATEGLTEGAQSIVENAFPKYLFDKDQKLLEGVVESMLIGAALGGFGGAGESVSMHREASHFARESGKFSQDFQDTATRIQEAIKKSNEEYWAQVKPILPEAPPEPALAPAVERPGPQPVVATPEEQQQAIFGGELGQVAGRIAPDRTRIESITEIVDSIGPDRIDFGRAERFYDLYRQRDAATALQEFPEFSTWAPPAQREAARGLPSAFTGKARQVTPAPMGVTGMETATRATTPASGAAEPSTPGLPPSPGTAAPAPTITPVPMGVTGTLAEDVATREQAGRAGADTILQGVTESIRGEQAMRDRVIDQAGGAVPMVNLRRMAVQEVESRLARGEEVEPEILARFPTLAKKYGKLEPSPAPREVIVFENPNQAGTRPVTNEPSGSVNTPQQASNAFVEGDQGVVTPAPTETVPETKVTPGPTPAPTEIVQPAASGEVAPETQAPIESPVARSLPSLDASSDEWLGARSQIINEIDSSDHPDRATALQVISGRHPSTWDRGTDVYRNKLTTVLRDLGYDIDPVWDNEIIDALVQATPAHTGPLSAPKTNMEVLQDLSPGAWQAFSQPFTDAEVELLGKAIDAGVVKVKQIGGKTAYGHSGDLRGWLAEQGGAESVPKTTLTKKAGLGSGKKAGPVAQAKPVAKHPGLPKGITGKPTALAPDLAQIARAGTAWDNASVQQKKEWVTKSGWIPESKSNLQWRHLTEDAQKALSNIIPTQQQPSAPAFKAGDRVSWTERGKTLTGTLKGAPDRFGNVDINVDQVVKAGGVPVGRVSMDVKVESLTKLEAAPATPEAKPEVAPVKFETGDKVSWTSNQGEHQTGTIVGEGTAGLSVRLERNGKPVTRPDGVGTVVYTLKKEQLTKVESKGPTPAAEISAAAHVQVANQVKDWFETRDQHGAPRFPSTQLYAWADEAYGGTMAQGTYTPKDAYDAMELGVNQYIQAHPEIFDPHSSDPAQVVFKLRQLQAMLPTQTRRTGEMDEFQQFSTPPALAYMVNWVANIGPNDVALEPSGGIGGIAVFASNAGAQAVIVNELSPRRAELLREMGFDQVFTENAEQLNNVLPKTVKPTVVVMNPPFSATAGRMMGKRISQTGAQHIEQALKRLEPGGRLVAIVGRGMAFGKPTFQTWWGKIKKEYNVLANVGISGKNYTKYGTSFDNQILVIDKTGPTSPTETVAGFVENIEDLIPLLEGVKDARQLVTDQPGSQAGATQTQDQAGPNGPTPRPTPGVETTAGTPDTGVTGGGTEVDVSGRSDGSTTPGDNAGVRGKSGKSGGTVGPTGPVQSGKTGGPGKPDSGNVGATGVLDVGVQPVGGQPGPGASGTVEAEATEGVESKSELTDKIYEDYSPQRLKVPGAKPHPAPLVESAAMSSVKPPAPNYVPKIPQSVVTEGHLSAPQFEAVVYSGQAHDQMLESGDRRGFAIGDGTGVGKGREIAGIFMDNWNQGRKKGVWISQNNGLVDSAQRDVAGIGLDPKIVRPLPKNYNPITGDEGIIFVGYDTLKSSQATSKTDTTFIPQKRLDQLVKWLGEDFDGVIVFDEAHNMNKNTTTGQGLQRQGASQRALAGMELGKRLPNARIVYVSATFGEEVSHFGFADRLGLWGPGTEFANKTDFLNKIGSGGVAAMEVLARDMKAMGSYMARSLSYDGIQYDRLTHDLTPDQVATYDALAKTWQKVLENVDAALDLTGGADDSTTKRNARAQFWGYNQRFFNQVTTALTMPSVLSSLEADLAAGHSPVLQLVNTYGDATDKAIKNRGEDVEIDEIDFTPRQMLAQYLEKSFPVVQFEEYTDDNGDTQVRVALDSNGNPVLNQEAVEARDKLLEELGAVNFPDNPIDQLINKFGPGMVAEITGRKQRVVRVKGETKVEKRNQASVDKDQKAFEEGTKRILVFSQKGDTGASYHADLSIKNQALRRHYLLQAGWQAKRALQGFGRTHRTNQAQAPQYILVETNIKGHKRFISSIARRLDQLGALTKGQRQTGSSGLLKASDNLETTHAQIAVDQFVDKLLAGQIQGMDAHDFEAQTGWRLTYTSGGSVTVNYPNIKQFMNRLLAMEVASQDTVFDAFDQLHQEVLTRAADQGTLDFGMETIFPEKGGRIEKVSEELVYTEPKSGAETSVVAFDITNPTKPVTWNVAKGWSDTVFITNNASGHVWAVDGKPLNRTKADGSIVREYKLLGQRYGARQWVEENTLLNKQKWTQVKKADAEPLWNAAVAKLPKESTERLNMITGALLPIWNRLSGDTRVKRLQTQDGIKYLGRVIPNSELNETLTALGATPQAQKLDVKNSGDILEKVLDNNWTVTLANGWTFRRALVSGEQRIELIGFRPEDLSELTRAGLIVERIDYKTRAFIPVEKSWTKTNSDLKAIDAIIKSRPIVEAAPRFANQGAARYSLAGRAGLGAGPAPGEGSTITLQAVKGQFGGVKVQEIEGNKGFHLTLPNGKLLMILTGQDLTARRDEILKTYGREMKAGEWVAGEWRQMSVGGVIALAKAAGIRTLNHETFHAACDLVLSQKELDAILRKYGDWETAARAYETWKPAESHKFFQKILNFFRRLAGLLGPTADGTFAKIKSGEVWTRTAVGTGTGEAGLAQQGISGVVSYSIKDRIGTTWKDVRQSIISGVGRSLAGSYKAYSGKSKEYGARHQQDVLDELMPYWKPTVVSVARTLDLMEKRLGKQTLDRLVRFPREFIAEFSSRRSEAGEGGFTGSYDPQGNPLPRTHMGIEPSSTNSPRPDIAGFIIHEILHGVQHEALKTPVETPKFAKANWEPVSGGYNESVVESLTETLLAKIFPEASIIPNATLNRAGGAFGSAFGARYETTPESRSASLTHLQEILGTDLYKKLFPEGSATEPIAQGGGTGLAKKAELGTTRYSITSAQATLDDYHSTLMAQDPASKSLWRRFWDKDPALKASWTDIYQRTYDQIVDRFAPGERAQEKLVKAGIAMPAGEQFTSTIGFWRGQEGWNHEAVLGAGVYYDPVETAASGESFFSGATPTRVGDSLFKRVDPIRDLAKARGLENKEAFRDLRLLMVAQRDLELAGETGTRGPGTIKGVRPDESRAALQALETKYGSDFTRLQEVADGIREWADQAILQRLLQGGVITRGLYDQIKSRNQAYIPFMRLMDELDGYIEATGGGRVIKEIKGSERAIVDPFQMLIELSAKANYAYAKNRMFRSLYQMGQASPEMGIEIIKSKIVPSGMTRVDKWDPLGRSGWAMQAEIPRIKKGYAFSPLAPEKGAVPFYKDGKRVWLKLPPDLYGMTQNLLPQDLGLLMRILKWPADVLRTGAVTTPEFGLIKNPIRDTIQAWVFNRAGFSPLKWFRDLYLLLSKNPATMQMRSEMAVGGGFMATLAQSTVEEKITAADIEGKKKNIWYAAHPVEALRTLSAYLENLTRFSLYKQARENGFSHADAIHEARRTTLDFRRLGAHPVARYLNMIIPFWNANIQGADKLITELRGPNKAAVMRRLGTLMAASVGLALLFHGDDRLKELEDWEKNYFWHIPLGKDGPIIRIPKPFEAGIMFGSIPERIVEVAMGDNTTGLQAAFKAAVGALIPEIIPAALRPFVEMESNYNFFLGRPIEDASLQSLPVELRSKPWTSSLAKAISAHGGNLIGLSPVKVESFVRSFSGGLGANYYFPGADILLRKAGILEDLPNPQQDAIERAFGVRALFTKPPSGYRAKSVGDFFENVQGATQADQGWKLLWNTGSMDKLDDFLKANPEAMFARVARKQMSELGKIKKERNAIHSSKILSSEQKKAKLDALDEKIVTLAKIGNALMDPAVAEAVKMPSRKGMDDKTYYSLVSEPIGDAYEAIKKDIPRITHMDEAQRQRYLIKAIRQAREDYKPILKKPKDETKPESPFAKPTRAERANWQSVMGFKKAKAGEATGYRLKEEAP